MTSTRWALTTLLLCGLLGCSEEVSAPEGFTTQCSICHDVDALGAPRCDEEAGPLEWMTEASAGLQRTLPAMPSSRVRLELRWAGRGRHGSDDLADCSPCHPVRADGAGHGLRIYAAPERVFAGGVACMGSCHVWLAQPVQSVGFAQLDGVPVQWSGLLNPWELLRRVPGAHTELWRSGADLQGRGAGVDGIRPGCGGCHNLRSEAHGARLECTDCHLFEGEEGALHVAHVDAITERMPALDPQAAAAERPACTYCHPEADGLRPRSRAVCYGCHLSGHQPLDASGAPHFWPAVAGQ